MVDELCGLTSAEVAARRAEGLDNSFVANPSKSNWDIIRGNTFTLFNVSNFVIAAAVLAIRSWANALFILLIISNIILGIVVEMRARAMVARLNLLNTDPVPVVRGGVETRVPPAELVMGDVLRLATGAQVPSDAVVLSGHVEVNEALLTGEADLLDKPPDAHLLSGSFIASGQCFARVEHVGAENYSTKLAVEAKQYRPIESELMHSLGIVMKFVSWIALPLGIILLIQSVFFSHVTLYSAILATSAALLGMIPRGMAVLIAITLVTGVVKLGRQNVLVQEMYAIETMAHADTLCLDKTGTLTRGVMQVVGFELLADEGECVHSGDIAPTSDAALIPDTEALLKSYLQASTDVGTTMEALRDYFIPNPDKNEIFDQQASTMPVIAGFDQQSRVAKSFAEADNPFAAAISAIPSSSQRKWGAVTFRDVGTVVLGAPERLLTPSRLPAVVTAAQSQGFRVLLLGTSQHTIDKDTSLHRYDIRPLAYITLDDPVRESATQTLNYLREQDVELKIISGDNPVTVSKIAEKAGFAHFERYLDTSELSDEELVASVTDTAIFGRVSPQQKCLLIRALRDAGKTVGMVGDGVNDILAMREANLSIAMSTGDSATKQIANLVLLNSDFADVPAIMFEARRVVNNMLRSASIFFVKTIYSFFLVLLSVFSAFTGTLFIFPFVTIQITLADQTVGWPSLWISFQNDRSPVAKNFLKLSLLRALPNAALITACITFLHYYGPTQGWTPIETLTLSYLLLGLLTFLNVARACWPPTLTNIFLIAATAIGYYGALLLIGPYIGLGTLTPSTTPTFAILATASTGLWLAYQQLYRRVWKLP